MRFIPFLLCFNSLKNKIVQNAKSPSNRSETQIASERSFIEKKNGAEIHKWGSFPQNVNFLAAEK